MADLLELIKKANVLSSELSAEPVITSTKKRKNSVPSFCPQVRWRRRDKKGQIIPLRTREKKTTASYVEKPKHGNEHVSTVHQVDHDPFEQLQDIVGRIPEPVQPHTSEWNARQSSTKERWQTARPQLIDSAYAAEDVFSHTCQYCENEAKIKCQDCLPKPFFCEECDSKYHTLYVLHNRESMLEGFFQPISPTCRIERGSDGNYKLAEKVCLLPVILPRSICTCGPDLLQVSPGRHVILITMNGRFDLSVPSLCCSHCGACWVPGIKDLVKSGLWPASMKYQTVYSKEVFLSFEDAKVLAPGLSRHAFIKFLERRSLRYGRMGTICGDTFQRTFLEYHYTYSEEAKLMKKDPLICPACFPNMLAVSADGNRKQYRFMKIKGTGDPAFYQGLFFANDEEVASFVENIRREMKGRPGSRTCGTTTWAAAREAAPRSSSKLDEEGMEIAVCRHGFLLRGLNMYRGEVFAYPLFLQKDLATRHNITFFCTDTMCQYWPYLEKTAVRFTELQTLLNMKPFLSVLHAKAHTSKCEIVWGGRNQEGAGTTIGEEVEQVNSYMSRVALTTKHMSKEVRTDMITIHVMGWNMRKMDSLDTSLFQRYLKTVQREKNESEKLCTLMEEVSCSKEDQHKWVSDVQQWAKTGRAQGAPGSLEEMQHTIEGLFINLHQRKRDLYRQNDSSKRRMKNRKKIGQLKDKLRHAIASYNERVTDPASKIQESECDPDENIIWPWEKQADGSAIGLGIKRQMFDQVMLVKRLGEEKHILLSEMAQHCVYLQKKAEELRDLLNRVTDNAQRGFPPGLSAEGCNGFSCALRKHLQHNLSQLAKAKNMYRRIICDGADLLKTLLVSGTVNDSAEEDFTHEEEDIDLSDNEEEEVCMV